MSDQTKDTWISVEHVERRIWSVEIIASGMTPEHLCHLISTNQVEIRWDSEEVCDHILFNGKMIGRRFQNEADASGTEWRNARINNE